MTLAFASLGSGSRGNALLIESAHCLVMVDCGFSVKGTVKRLARLGRKPEDLTAILVTHEHSDHIAGVARLSRRFELPVWMTPGTYAQAPDQDFHAVRTFNCHRTLQIEDIEVTPIPVPHDAREPCQFRFESRRRRLGVLTDTGHVTPHVERALSGCHGLAVEFNHDWDQLWAGNYPWSIKDRVAGPRGHLNNQQAAELVGNLIHPELSWVVGLHLSERNNSAEAVHSVVEKTAVDLGQRLFLADQVEGMDWREV
jgi:phosphoribosyl 1,2-cyclic phosphodiesterase